MEELKGSIKKVGFLAYNDIILSDHRGMFVDVDINELMGKELKGRLRPAARILNGSVPSTVEQYLVILKKEFKCHHIHRKVKRLDEEWGRHRTEEEQIIV